MLSELQMKGDESRSRCLARTSEGQDIYLRTCGCPQNMLAIYPHISGLATKKKGKYRMIIKAYLIN